MARSVMAGMPLYLVLLALFMPALAYGQPGQSIVATQIRLSMSNVFLLRLPRPVLIDAGGKNDMPGLEEALARESLSVKDIAAVLLTHGHSDHAALAAGIRQRSGAAIMTGRAERVMVNAGRNDNLNPTNLMAMILKNFAIDPVYEPFVPDLEVEGEMELSRLGIPGRAIQMPGHTPGSVVYVLDDGRAFAGDMILGGWFGGALFSRRPGEHYFHADIARNRQNVIALLKSGVRSFHVGHGGPLTRESVAEWIGEGQ